MIKILRKTLTQRIGYIADIQCSRNFSKLALRNYPALNLERKTYLCASGASFVRFSSNIPVELMNQPTAGVDVAVPIDALADKIPEAPAVPPAELFNEEVIEAVNAVAANGEPTFASLGLGGWSPIGLVQHAMEYVHVTLDVPWWGTILIGTFCVRMLIFPLVIMSQRNAAKLNNNLPEMQTLQIKMTQARQTGNQIEAARYGQEIMMFMKEKGLSPLKNLIVPFAQAPLFISFFIGLRRMANCPVESMTHGGLFWFTDLTVPDQYFLLPIITSLTLFATIELGVDGTKMHSNTVIIKYFLRALPIVMLPFTVTFPGAILCYWCSTNFISLLQVGALKIPRIRQFFKIPAPINHPTDALPIKSKGFVSDVKNSWTNMKITRELNDRQRTDEMLFNRAGKAALQKTYKFDPTKVPLAMQPKK